MCHFFKIKYLKQKKALKNLKLILVRPVKNKSLITKISFCSRFSKQNKRGIFQ